jgi:hypothetical protein
MLFAHSADPYHLSGAELFGDWVLALVTLLLTGGLTWVAMAPLFQKADARARQELVGWVGMGLGILIVMGSWITRQSIESALQPAPVSTMHMVHGSQNGGQVVMWGDYHAELARLVSGEYRLWLSDGTENSIGAAFFSGKLLPRDPKTGKLDTAQTQNLETSLDGLSRTAQLPREVKSVQVQLVYPGNTIKLNFTFDGGPRRKSLMQWCGSRPTP